MKQGAVILLGLTVILGLSFTGAGIGYESEFHIPMTREAGNRSKLNDYLKTQLRLTEGASTEFTGPDKGFGGGSLTSTRTASEWIARGSLIEDHPMGLRARTHFYDPVNERGLTDLPEWLQTSDHALIRARGDGEIPFAYSWTDANNYYYVATSVPL